MEMADQMCVQSGKTLIATVKVVYICVTVVVLCMYAVLYDRYSKGIKYM